MSEMKLYTAVGRFINRRDRDGQEYPVIILGNKEYLVDPQEFMMWINANWRICVWDEIGRLYEVSAAKAHYQNPRTWEVCANRLLVRGLLVSGCGETKADALYDLLSSMYILPARGRVTLRIYAVLKMVLLHRVSIRRAMTVFKCFKHTPQEKQILRLTNQALLSTAEVITCMEKGIRYIGSEYTLMDKLYADPEITGDNIGQTAKAYPCCHKAVEAISNLYLNQLVIFDRV